MTEVVDCMFNIILEHYVLILIIARTSSSFLEFIFGG